jgi:hypothetical protein
MPILRPRQSDRIDSKFRMAAQDIGRLLSLSSTEFAATKNLFSRFEPTTASISEDEAREWAIGEGVPPEDLVAMIRLAGFVTFDVPDIQKRLDDVIDRIAGHLEPGNSKAEVGTL